MEQLILATLVATLGLAVHNAILVHRLSRRIDEVHNNHRSYRPKLFS